MVNESEQDILRIIKRQNSPTTKRIFELKPISKTNEKLFIERNRFLKMKGVGTQRRYHLARDMIYWLIEEVGNKEANKITKQDLESYVEKALDKLINGKTTQNVIQNRLGNVKSFIAWVNKDKGEEFIKNLIGWIKVKVRSSSDNKNREDQQEPEIIDYHDVQKMQAITTDYQEQTIISSLWETGYRAYSEFLQLNIEDIKQDGPGGTWIIRHPGLRSSVPLIHTQAFLSRWLGLHPLRNSKDKKRPLFVNTKGERFSPKGLHGIVKKIGRKVGITDKNVIPQNFRHGFATYQAHNVTESELRELMGHKKGSQAVNKYYLKTQAEETRQKLARLAGVKMIESEDADDNIFLPRVCPECTYANTSNSKFCCECGIAVVKSEKIKLEKQSMEKEEKMVNEITRLVKGEMEERNKKLESELAESNLRFDQLGGEFVKMRDVWLNMANAVKDAKRETVWVNQKGDKLKSKMWYQKYSGLDPEELGIECVDIGNPGIGGSKKMWLESKVNEFMEKNKVK